MTLRVYNVIGELVKTLVDEIQPIGNYEVMWDGKDSRGRKLLSGYYFYRLTMNDKTLTTKALLLKIITYLGILQKIPNSEGIPL